MGGAARWRSYLADWTETPKTLVANAPHISLTGHAQLVVENHRGLSSCFSDRMVVDSAQGSLTILGENLVVQLLTRDELIITGRIHQVLLS